jgi:hypothetical protein
MISMIKGVCFDAANVDAAGRVRNGGLYQLHVLHHELSAEKS